jgi:uroporphyrinogen-III synthase
LRVLVTRPKFDAERTASRLAALGHEAIIDSVIEVETLPFDASCEGFSTLAFTSANGARVASAYDNLKNIPAFAVGRRTAEAARENGFKNVSVARGDVVALGKRIAAALPSGAKVLHIAGEDRAGDLQGKLAESGITVETRIAYRARVSPGLRRETLLALRNGGVDAVLHYSERSAATFLRMTEAIGIGNDIRTMRHLCLSSAVAAPLKSLSARVEIAASPDEEALFKLLGA